jgi:hypothetical protein
MGFPGDAKWLHNKLLYFTFIELYSPLFTFIGLYLGKTVTLQEVWVWCQE